MKLIPRCLLVTACLILPLKAAVTLNQVENFAGIHGWITGDPNPNPPTVQTDSGPLGSGDNSLRVSSNGGSSAGGRLIIFNRSLWTGDYTAAGIVRLSADLRNNGTTVLSMRVAVNGPGGWFVTTVAPITPFSGWNQQAFDLRPAALISAGGSNAATTLAAVTELRILHSATVDFRGARISSSFLVDNVRVIPEPSAVMVIMLVGCLLFFRKR